MSVDQHRHLVNRVSAPVMRLWRSLNTNNLLQDGGIIAGATIASGGLNYLFQVIMGRALGPAEFGAFGALFALFYLVSVLGRGIRYSASHFAASLVDLAGARRLHRGILLRALLIGIGVFAFLALTSPFIGSILGVEYQVVLIVALTIPPALALSASQGTLEGHQHFLTLGVYKILQAGLKLFFGVLLVVIGFGIYGAFAGIFLAIVLTLGGIAYHLNRRWPRSSVREPAFAFDRAYRYGGPAVLAGFCLAVPTNADVILVKHLFVATDAGLYAATAVLGKVLVFVPMGISIALFPKVSAENGPNGYQLNELFDRALLAAAFVVVTGALAYWIAPELILGTFFGTPYLAAAPLLQWYGLAMVAFVLAVVVLNFELARNRLSFVYLFAGVSVLEIALIAIFHASMLQVIQIVLLANTALFAWGVIRVKFNQ